MTTSGDTLAAELEALIADEPQATPPAKPAEAGNAPSGTTPPQDSQELKGKEGAQVMAARIREATEKARIEEREALAKADGFTSYADRLKASQEKALKDQGLDPETVKPIFDKMYEQKMSEDPRVKELERLKAQEIEKFGQQQLAELSKELGREIKPDELDQKVLDLWKEKGDLTGAYMFYHGRTVARGAALSATSAQSKGSTAHLASPQGGAPQSDDGTRPLTAAEKVHFREINPSYTDEELSKKRIKK
jgi:hypothetical protein